MPARLLVVLVTIAALLGAPSLASAAGNALSAPSVSPTSGTVTTVFTLRVSYEGRFPALAVTVSVAGLPLPMARISGTPDAGVWSVSTLLPAGSWTPTFSSLTERGNAASLTGPTISVGGWTATPEPTAFVPSPRSGGIDSGDPGLPSDPADPVDPGAVPVETGADDEPSAAADPIASSGAAPSSGDRGEGGTSVPAGPSAPAGSSGGGSGDEGGDEGAAGAGGDGGDGGGGGDAPAPAPAEAPRAQGSGEPDVMPVSDETTAEEPPAVTEDASVDLVLVSGLAGGAAVTIIGVTLLLLGARRRQAQAAAPVRVPSLADTEALLDRRTLRQAKVRLSEDPIVAAMGVEEQVAARRQRRRTDQVDSGPGERPPHRRR